jgi:5-methylcytosine-specific restriction endonuclease McrA
MSSQRKPIGKRLRFEIFKRDGFTCQYCGGRPPAVVLQVDHVIAVSHGGTNEIENLITACFECNSGKSDRNLADVPDSIKQKIARQRESSEQISEYYKFLEQARQERERVVGELGSYWCDSIVSKSERGQWTWSQDRKRSARRFLQSLNPNEIRDAIDLAILRLAPSLDDDSAAWKYFCGICWSKIRESRSDCRRTIYDEF